MRIKRRKQTWGNVGEISTGNNLPTFREIRKEYSNKSISKTLSQQSIPTHSRIREHSPQRVYWCSETKPRIVVKTTTKIPRTKEYVPLRNSWASHRQSIQVINAVLRRIWWRVGDMWEKASLNEMHKRVLRSARKTPLSHTSTRVNSTGYYSCSPTGENLELPLSTNRDMRYTLFYMHYQGTQETASAVMK